MAMTKIKGLQMWCARQVEGYRDVEVRDMTSSWKSGLAFCALIHKYRPDLIDYDSLSKENIFENNQLAFEVADHELGIAALLDAQDMVDIRIPDKLSVVTYVSQYYNYFRDAPKLGGPGITAKQTGVSSNKRSPAVQPSPGPEMKRFAPANAKNTTPKTSTLGDKCVICLNKVYLLERHIENGKLYHRSCFRHSDLSPTTKVFKNSPAMSDDFVSRAKVRKTDDNPSWAKSNGLKHVDTPHIDKKELKSNSEISSKQPAKPDLLLERLKSRIEEDRKKEEAISYKQNKRPLIFQTKAPEEVKKSETPNPTSNAKKFELSKVNNGDVKLDVKESEQKTGFIHSRVNLVKRKEPELDSKTALTRSDKEKTTFEKMDTSEPYSHKLKHVSPTPARRNLNTDNDKNTKSRPDKLKISPVFGKKLNQDKSEKMVSPPGSPPPPLPSSQPPGKLATKKFSPLDESAPAVPSSLPPSLHKASHTSANLSTTNTSTTSQTKTTQKLGILKTTTTSSISTSTSGPSLQSNSTTSSILKHASVTAHPVPRTQTSSILKASGSKTTTTSSILKNSSVAAAPAKPSRLSLIEGTAAGRADRTMDVDQALDRAAHHRPGTEPVAVLVVPTERSPQHDKKVLGGLLTSLANVRKSSVTSPTEPTPDSQFPIEKSKSNVKTESAVKTSKAEDVSSKSTVGQSVLRTKVDSGVSKGKEVDTDKKGKETSSSILDKLAALRKDKQDDKESKYKKDGLRSSGITMNKSKPSAIFDTSSSGTDSGDGKSKVDRPVSRLEDKGGRFKKDVGGKDPRANGNIELQDSSVSSNKRKDDVVPSWKKEQNQNKVGQSERNGSALLRDSKLESNIQGSEISAHTPAWKQGQHNTESDKHKSSTSSNLLPDSKPAPQPVSDDDSPAWMKALEKRKAEKSQPKSRPQSVGVLEESSSGRQSKPESKVNLPERRGNQTEDKPSPKARPKSAFILTNESESKPSWQIEAERRMSHNKDFVDPEKVKPEAKPSAPVKKPRRIFAPSSPTSSVPSQETSPELPPSRPPELPPSRPPERPAERAPQLPPSRPPERPPSRPPPPAPVQGSPPTPDMRTTVSAKSTSPTPVVPVRQLKKISLETNFNFKSQSTEEPPSPLRSPPIRPPPPTGGNLKVQNDSPSLSSPQVIQRQLNDIDTKLTELELRGRQLEDSIRNVGTTEEEDDMMIEWFKLINSKNELVRKEADLIYMSKEQDLEDEQEDIDSMLRFLMSIPDSDKTEQQKERETILFEKKMTVINARSNIVDSIDEDRIRYEEEDRDIAIMLQEKGFLVGNYGKVQPKQKKSRKGAFVSYADLN